MDSKDNLILWEKGQSGNPNGRPKKLLRHFNEQMKAEGYERVSPTQIAEAYELLMNLTAEDISKVAQDKKQPMLLRIVAKGIADKKMGHEMIEKIIDRAHGKSRQKIDHVTDGYHMPVPTIVLNVNTPPPPPPPTPESKPDDGPQP